jgi:hypothetical protein
MKTIEEQKKREDILKRLESTLRRKRARLQKILSLALSSALSSALFQEKNSFHTKEIKKISILPP